MSEEYLWDKSGEPDPEIKQLEEILGTLRYQPKALELPDAIKPDRRNRYLPLVAIAATLLMALFAGALWVRLKTDEEPQLHKATIAVPSSVPSPEAPRTTNQDDPKSQPQTDVVAHNNRSQPRSSPRSIRKPSLSPAERQQALKAKEQLMVALRLASEKLNIVQRKTQGPASPGQIRNQHKVG